MMIDEQFIKEKINPIVGDIFHSARRLGFENAPRDMDMQYLKQGTEQIKELLEKYLQAAIGSPGKTETEK